MIDNVNAAWPFVCSLYGIVDKHDEGIDNARQNIFVKA